MNSASYSVTSMADLAAALESAKQDFTASVAVAFCDPDFPFQEATELFRSHQIKLVGCTTSGEICNDVIQEGSFSFLLMDMNPSFFEVTHFDHEDMAAYSSGKKLLEQAKSRFDQPGIFLLISGVRILGDGPVNGIRDSLEAEIPIFGGLAGDNLQHEATYVFTENGVSDFGIASMIVDLEHIQMEGLAVSGWQPLGRTHHITKSKDNLIFEIDNKPALDLFLSYFGHIEYKPSSNANLRPLSGEYPLKIYREDGTSYLRSLLIYDIEDRALMAAGEIPQGAEFKFCPPPDFDVVEQTVREFESFSQAQKEFDSLVMVSCKGRHNSFGPVLSDEVSSIYEIWKTPMVGYLSNGEIGSAKERGVCEFHNVTCSLFGLKERKRG